ncbi:acyltransferase-domain-containing protein [Gonapodya prolifera JEL478]|uniref:Acyltransferase-domain-containing protein n=1 Tax=Gonapodya prolifera (strain JEL478) TaxID=1344416 RepID=A0A139AW92_GONPJ|nr:acyltransferase-domain-containing protein [Gonapodya prolifera JEL478]|eukprot:KXS20853.1 acyltransferase-domain-containing protein [Gonapodya prolifera JEL478]
MDGKISQKTTTDTATLERYVSPEEEDETLSGDVSALQDGLAFIAFGAQAIAQDEFTKCFASKPPPQYSFTPRDTLKLLGAVVRYGILFPLRLLFLLLASLVFFAALPLINSSSSTAWQKWAFQVYAGAFLISFGSRIRYRNKKFRPKMPHIYVANHTSPLDFIVLCAYDFPHAVIMQKQGGLFGFFQKHVLRLNGSVYFDRKDKNDRSAIAKLMKAHASDVSRAPLLLFPEGTCVNNEYTVLFHKGAFDLDVAICPVAIKYDKSWGDAYWQSSAQSFSQHFLYLMTRWALVADVWFLPPATRLPNESAGDFAFRVKTAISERARLKNLSWDGYMKHSGPAKEKREKMREQGQAKMGEGIIRKLGEAYRRKHIIRRTRRSHSVSCLRELHPPMDESEGTATPSVDLPSFETVEFRRARGGTMEDVFGDVRNDVLVAQQAQEIQKTDLAANLETRLGGLVESWKQYAKMSAKFGGFDQRRLEYLKWRVWFKQRQKYIDDRVSQGLLRRPSLPRIASASEIVRDTVTGAVELVGGIVGELTKRTRALSGGSVKVSALGAMTMSPLFKVGAPDLDKVDGNGNDSLSFSRGRKQRGSFTSAGPPRQAPASIRPSPPGSPNLLMLSVPKMGTSLRNEARRGSILMTDKELARMKDMEAESGAHDEEEEWADATSRTPSAQVSPDRLRSTRDEENVHGVRQRLRVGAHETDE